ncbi:hypothetical protein [Streptomyces sp. NBC_01614]|uniref:hypothetical protein n=1 Tax=Streptomyces sp. NBC_01614 TaxID=2975897 RepID=UPI0038639A21
MTLGAPVAVTAVRSVKEVNSEARVVTFDNNPALVKALRIGDVEWAIDQQPYLQRYEAVGSLSLHEIAE